MVEGSRSAFYYLHARIAFSYDYPRERLKQHERSLSWHDAYGQRGGQTAGITEKFHLTFPSFDAAIRQTEKKRLATTPSTTRSSPPSSQSQHQPTTHRLHHTSTLTDLPLSLLHRLRPGLGSCLLYNRLAFAAMARERGWLFLDSWSRCPFTRGQTGKVFSCFWFSEARQLLKNDDFRLDYACVLVLLFSFDW